MPFSEEVDPKEMSREELMRELDKAGEDTAALELNGLIAQSQIRYATFSDLRKSLSLPPKAAP